MVGIVRPERDTGILTEQRRLRIWDIYSAHETVDHQNMVASCPPDVPEMLEITSSLAFNSSFFRMLDLVRKC